MRLSSPVERLFGFDELKLDDDSVLDFWLWSYSILANDPTKGEFAEWMVGKLLGQMARWNHKISLPSGTKLPQTPRFNQLWKRYEDN
jgi:hypothetical protein